MRRAFLVLLSTFSLAAAGSMADTAPAAAESMVLERPDGSLQCERGASSKELLRDAKKELSQAGVRVLTVALGHDGKVHAQMCGAPTGRVIRIRIRPSDREKVAAMGFSVPDDSGQ